MYSLKVRSRTPMPAVPLVTIFCEGAVDAALYEDLRGTAIGRLIRFVGPPSSVTDEGGALWAYDQMRKVRREALNDGELRNGVNKAYCLLDGEERLRAGALTCHLDSERLIHTQAMDYDGHRRRQACDFRDLDGVLFLNCHEKENLHFLYGGAWEEMKRGWTKPRKMFGRLIGPNDQWRIIHRAAAYSMMSSITKRYLRNSNDLKKILGKLKGRGGDTDQVVEMALDELKMLLPPETFEIEAGCVQTDLAAIDESVDLDFFERRDRFRFCDGRALLGLCTSRPAELVQRTRTTMMDGRLPAIFQTHLIEALFGEGRLNQDLCERNFGGRDFHLSIS